MGAPASGGVARCVGIVPETARRERERTERLFNSATSARRSSLGCDWAELGSLEQTLLASYAGGSGAGDVVFLLFGTRIVVARLSPNSRCKL